MSEKTHTTSILNWNILSEYKSELYGFTMLWIMIFHSYLAYVHFFKDAGLPLDLINTIVTHGNMGCDIFLFLSGIYAYYSFLKKPGYFNYERKRIIRLILPTILINGIYWIYLLVKTEHNIGYFIMRITLTKFWLTGDQQIWFISLIFVCYLLYPLIHKIIYDKELQLRVIPWILCVIITFSLIMTLRVVKPDTYSMLEICLNRIPIFVIGCGFGACVKNKKEIPAWVVPVCIAVVIGSLYILHEISLDTVVKRYLYMAGVAYILIAAFILKLLNCKWLNTFLSYFGKRSIELYLWQILLLRLYKLTPLYVKGSTRRYLLLLLIAAILAYVIEKIESVILPHLTPKKHVHDSSKHKK